MLLAGLIVLGIDPGTAATGYGIVERTGSELRARRLRLPRDAVHPGSCRSGCSRSTAR